MALTGPRIRGTAAPQLPQSPLSGMGGGGAPDINTALTAQRAALGNKRRARISMPTKGGAGMPPAMGGGATPGGGAAAATGGVMGPPGSRAVKQPGGALPRGGMGDFGPVQAGLDELAPGTIPMGKPPVGMSPGIVPSSPMSRAVPPGVGSRPPASATTNTMDTDPALLNDAQYGPPSGPPMDARELPAMSTPEINVAGGAGGGMGEMEALGNANTHMYGPNVPDMQPAPANPLMQPGANLGGAQQAGGFVGRGGNQQAMGGGQFGGAPPQDVLARRRGLTTRMQSAIQRAMGGG